MTSQSTLSKPLSLVFGESRATACVTNHVTLGQSTTEPPVSSCSRSNTSISPNAVNLLLNVKEDDERDLGRKRAGGMRVFGRRSPSLGDVEEEGNKRYSKLGILLSDETNSSAGTHTLMVTGSEVMPGDARTYTMPSVTSSSHNATGRSSQTDVLSLSDQLTATLTETPPNVSLPRPVTNTKSSDTFEWVDVEQGDDGACLIVINPSPPISIQSGSSNNTVHEVEDIQPSSPDSGYGITPDNVKHSRGADGVINSDLGVTVTGQSPNRLPEQSLSRQRSGAINEEEVVLNDPARDERCRGDTDNSVFSVDSGEASPGPSMSAESSPRPSVSSDYPSTSLDPRPMLKHTMSAPDRLVALNRVPCPVTTPDTIPEHITMPFLVSSSINRTMGSVSEHRTGTPSKSHSMVSSSSCAGNMKEMEQQLQSNAQVHVSPSQPPCSKDRYRAITQTSLDTRLKPLGPRRSKVRASSQPFSKAADVRLISSHRTETLPTNLKDTKDFFQVTDELSKENSHFTLSEALLSVIEQYTASYVEHQFEEVSVPPSPTPTCWSRTSSESIDLSQGRLDFSQAGWSPGQITPMSERYSLGSPGTDVHFIGSPTNNDGLYIENSLSSMSSLNRVPPYETRSFSEPYSLHTAPQLSLLQLIQSSLDNSAESTAQRLLRYLAGQLTGNVAEANFSQVVLQLPTSFLASLQMDEDLQKSVTTSSAHIRGNREWAPPRKQIIYTIKQPSRNLQKDLLAQGYRCTGCGMKVNPVLARYFRFCNYTGKYFCQNCHINTTSIIPACILEKWSFKKLYVSNFARDLLAKLNKEPVFTIADENSSIYSKVPAMAAAKEIRGQLIAVKQYLISCRDAAHLNLAFQGYSPWTVDLVSYSIDDFVELKSGTKMKYLRLMLADAISHIKSCALCKGKGFVCELCKSSEIIYPFESTKVASCSECKCCFHKTCYVENHTSCPRCVRMQQRLKRRLEQQATAGSNDFPNYFDSPT